MGGSSEIIFAFRIAIAAPAMRKIAVRERDDISIALDPGETLDTTPKGKKHSKL
jgi:hypothetical protein